MTDDGEFDGLDLTFGVLLAVVVLVFLGFVFLG